jgi:hypothetical protein
MIIKRWASLADAFFFLAQTYLLHVKWSVLHLGKRGIRDEEGAKEKFEAEGVIPL